MALWALSSQMIKTICEARGKTQSAPAPASAASPVPEAACSKQAVCFY